MGWCEREGEHLVSSLRGALKNLELEKKSKKLLEHVSQDVAKKMIQAVEESV